MTEFLVKHFVKGYENTEKDEGAYHYYRKYIEHAGSSA